MIIRHSNTKLWRLIRLVCMVMMITIIIVSSTTTNTITSTNDSFFQLVLCIISC
ncbi:unnamed protein product [Schistosoma mattheei]|uniref:Uncharacterized protein n=1 Tax=Schistosoma mattheei TaxID=31246 RepID=A0A3P8FDX8_9TREM|nr:unnamed protein product [Schistosoma mattheei]